jgi:cysteine sulfinate desulfinase/cysteine desulfurase-like protein
VDDCLATRILDSNGTTPHDPEMFAAIWPFMETDFGNPSNAHWYGNDTNTTSACIQHPLPVVPGCRLKLSAR